MTFAELCPSIRDRARTFTRELIEIEAQVCRKSWGELAGFGGVEDFTDKLAAHQQLTRRPKRIARSVRRTRIQAAMALPPVPKIDTTPDALFLPGPTQMPYEADTGDVSASAPHPLERRVVPHEEYRPPETAPTEG